MYKKQKRVAAPVASSSVVRFEAADRAISLVGREYVGLVNAVTPAGVGSTSAFATTYGLLRPTDTKLFSWMSAIASKFEKYKFTKLCFVYEPQCPTSTSGSVAMWFDPDPTHSVPADWNNMINTGVNTHGAPWTSHVLNVPLHLCAGRRQYYTKQEFADTNASSSTQLGLVPAAPTDPMEYFAGMYGFATQDIGPGTAAAQNVPVGKVYLDYAILLQTQATNSWNLTSMISAKPVPAEPASNSGSGLLLRSSFTGNWPTTAPAGGMDLLGKDYGTTPVPYVRAGSQYSQTNPVTGVVTILNNLDVEVFIGCRATVALTQLIIKIVRGNNADVPLGTSYAISSSTAGQAAAVSGVWYPWYMVPTAMGTTTLSFLGFLRLYGGDTISISIGSGGATQLNDATIDFIPVPFGLTQ